MRRSTVAVLVLAALVVVGCATTGGPAEPVTYRLDADDAVLTTSGALVLEEKEDGYNVGWWESTDDVISWEFEAEYSTDYAVALQLSCDPQFPGSTIAVTVGNQPVGELVVPDTGDWSTYTTREVGVVSLEAGTHTVELQATNVANRFVANLRRVILTTQ